MECPDRQIKVVVASTAPRLRACLPCELDVVLAGARVTNTHSDNLVLIPALGPEQVLGFVRVACRDGADSTATLWVPGGARYSQGYMYTCSGGPAQVIRSCCLDLVPSSCTNTLFVAWPGAGSLPNSKSGAPIEAVTSRKGLAWDHQHYLCCRPH